jgi:hypothetical protein
MKDQDKELLKAFVGALTPQQQKDFYNNVLRGDFTARYKWLFDNRELLKISDNIIGICVSFGVLSKEEAAVYLGPRLAKASQPRDGNLFVKILGGIVGFFGRIVVLIRSDRRTL